MLTFKMQNQNQVGTYFRDKQFAMSFTIKTGILEYSTILLFTIILSELTVFMMKTRNWKVYS